MLPIAISFLSIPLARMIWDPSKVDAMDKLLDAALTKIEGQVGAGPLPGGDRAYAEAVTAPLNGLADDVAEEELENHLSAIRALVDENMTFDVLLARAQNGDASTAGKCALMVMASDAAAIDRMDKQDVPLRAMDALSGDPALVARMAERLIKALRMDADIWYQCPNVGFLENLRQQAPSISDELSALEAEIVAQAPRD
jgi:hypothetical protein